MTLYELSKQYQDAFAALEVDEETGEVDFSSVIMIDAALEDKAINCALYLKGLDADIEAYKAEEERLKKWRKSAETKRRCFADYISDCMDMAKKSKIQDARVRLSFRASEQVVIDDAEMLPRKFVATKTEEKPDKTAIKAAIKSGVKVSGAHVESCRNLQVR